MELAKKSEAAGCDAVELNFSCPQMKYKGMGCDVGQDPELVQHYTACVKSCVSIPVIAKMTPNITHITEPATASLLGGADALSAINTIKSVTMDSDAEVSGHLTISGYSGRAKTAGHTAVKGSSSQRPSRVERPRWYRDVARRLGIHSVGL